MIPKLFSIFLATTFSICISIQGQQRITSKLNKHYFEIESKDSIHHKFSKVENVSTTGDTVTWIFDLQNRMVKQSKKGLNPAENFSQEIVETFDSTNQLISQSIINLDNSKYVTFYFRQGVKKAQVINHGANVFEIWRETPDSVYKSDYDEFKPGLDRNDWNGFLAKNLTYPSRARSLGATGTVILAILISKEGEPIEMEIANESRVNPHLSKEALRVVKLYKGPFIPAINIDGESIESWLYIPIRFKLS